jgi:iron complex transport system substrate-binding protein
MKILRPFSGNIVRAFLVLIAAVAARGLFAEAGGGNLAIVDMAGRKAILPGKIKRVFCTTPVGSAMVYSLAPEKLASWNFAFKARDLAFIDRLYRDLPAFGGSGQQFNTEEIIRAAPDLIIDFIGTGQGTKASKLIADTGIPAVFCDNGIDAIPACYRFLGKVLGVPERGERIAAYIEERLVRLRKEIAAIPESELARVYYAESEDGLMTDGSDSVHTQLMEYVRAVNVVTEKSGKDMRGLSVSLEQVLAWNPQAILASRHLGGERFVAGLASRTEWASIDAVRTGRVYLAPSGPFDWFDRPPCMMRALGALWLGKTLYPTRVSFDLRVETKGFYALVLRRELTDAEVDGILAGGIDWAKKEKAE